MRRVSFSAIIAVATLACIGTGRKCYAQEYKFQGVLDFSKGSVHVPKQLFGPERVTVQFDPLLLRSFRTMSPESWKVPGKDISKLLSQCRSVAYISRKARQGAYVTLLLELDSTRGHEKTIRNLKNAQPSAASLRLHVRTPRGSIVDLHEKEWEALRTKLLVLIDNAPVCYVASPSDAFVVAQPERATVSREAALSSHRVIMGSMGEKAVFTASSRKELVKKTDKFFAGLYDEQLVDDKMAVYSAVWQDQVKPTLDGDSIDKDQALAFHEYQANVRLALMAAKERRCTVTISTSNGIGAIVRYAKPPDAREGRYKGMGSPTMVIKELEPANYVFQSFRKGKKTGATDTIDCTGTSMPVLIEESEP